MKKILEWHTTLKLLGCSSTLSYDQSKRIVLSNQIMVLYFICLTPYIFIFNFMNSSLLSNITIGLSLMILVCLYLNKNKLFLLSRSLFILTISLPIYFFAAILGPETGIQFVTFMTMAISFVIFDDNQRAYRVVFMFLQMLIFLALEITDYSFVYKETFSALNYTYFRITVIVNVFILIFATLTYYSNLSRHFKDTLSTVSQLKNFTNRESEIISLVVEGKSNQEIADTLFIETSTIKTHLGKIFRKQNVINRVQLIAQFQSQINVNTDNLLAYSK